MRAGNRRWSGALFLSGSLLLAATSGCSPRAGPMDDPQHAGFGPMPGYPLSGQASVMLGPGPQAPGSGSARPGVEALVPLDTDRYVREVATGTPAGSQLDGGSTTFSPDGAWFASARRGEGSGQPILHVGPVAGPGASTQYVTTGQVFWAPDSRRLAFTQLTDSAYPQKYALRSWDLEAGRVGTIVEDVSVPQPWITWVDGGVVFVDGPDLVFKGKDAAAVRLSALAGAHSGVPGGQAVFPSPDGKRIALLAPATGFTAAASLVVHNLETRDAKALRRVPKDATPLVWAEGGDALGYLSGGYGQYELHKVRIADGSEEVTPFYLGEPVLETGPNWSTVSGPFASHLSPDLKWCLVSRGGPLYAREMATGRHVQLTSGRATPLPSAWTADSRDVFVYVRGGDPALIRYYKVQVER